MARRWMTGGLVAALALTVSARSFAQEPPTEPPAEHAAPEHRAATEEPGHGEHAGEDNPADFIMHHNLDSSEFELELPGPLYTGNNPKIDLAEKFAFLRFELKPGTCPADLHADVSLSDFTKGCIDLRPTKQTLMMWLAALILIVAMIFGTHRDKSKLVPRGTLPNLFEMLVLFVRDEIAIKNIGKEEGLRYTPFLLTAFFFILFMNLLGLVPFMATATANISITCGLALLTFIVTQAAGIRSAGLGGYLKHLTGGVHWALWPIMIPVEILGLFTKPFALTVRLFANMLAGHFVIFFVLALIFILSPAMAAVSVPLAMGIYFLELFVAFVQAYVFTMLSALFIGMGVAMGHHADHDKNAHGHKHAHVEGSHSHDHGRAHVLGG